MRKYHIINQEKTNAEADKAILLVQNPGLEQEKDIVINYQRLENDLSDYHLYSPMTVIALVMTEIFTIGTVWFLWDTYKEKKIKRMNQKQSTD
jgi:hypothetical protein